MIKIKIKGARGSGKSTVADIIEGLLKAFKFKSVIVEDGERHFQHRLDEHVRNLASRTDVKIKVRKSKK